LKIKTANLGNLNPNQREAVESTHPEVLVLAGAGSGKTKTLLQKIIYLIEEKSVSPSSILAVTFTKNAANEMVDRLILSADKSETYKTLLSNKKLTKQQLDFERFNFQKQYKWIDALTVRTFHSLCYAIMRTDGVNEFDNKFRIVSDQKRNEEDDLNRFMAPETVFEVVHKLLIAHCSDTEYLLKLKRYILDYIIDKIHIESKFSNVAVRDGRYFTCLDGTKVRSKSEQYIADWLFRHSIKYEYEPLLNVKDFYFRPDFYISEANLYIEHVSDKSYSTRQKEEQFEKGKILYVKTYEAMTKDSSLFNHTLDKIIKNRLPANYHKDIDLTYKEEFNGYYDDVRDFVGQVMRITDMLKVESTDVDQIAIHAAADQHERVRSFYELAFPIVKLYNEYCVDKSYLDFNDLISRTIALFKNYTDIANKYKQKYLYILVDEFQDVNNLQVELLKLFLTEKTQLFCVGDDWQSIYGFRGSNVSYIIDFEKHFPFSKIFKLNLNYRSTQHIVGASNEVIRNNKYKIDKEIIASKKSEHKIVVYAGDNDDDNVRFCVETVNKLYSEGYTFDDVLFLYRRSKMFAPYFSRFRNEGMRVQGKTIHAAKGLEAKVVFIIGLTEGYGGFPDIWLEDRIFQIIKQANRDLLLEEERRLFYVAITRAKDKLFLITEKGNESSFLREIPETFTVKTSATALPVTEKVILCENCFSRMENLWLVCPYCGFKPESVM